MPICPRSTYQEWPFRPAGCPGAVACFIGRYRCRDLTPPAIECPASTRTLDVAVCSVFQPQPAFYYEGLLPHCSSIVPLSSVCVCVCERMKHRHLYRSIPWPWRYSVSSLAVLTRYEMIWFIVAVESINPWSWFEIWKSASFCYVYQDLLCSLNT